MCSRKIVLFLLILSSLFISKVSHAEEESKAYRVPVIEVIGDSDDALDSIPGSGEVINSEILNQEKPQSLQDAVRKIPGVHIRGEDGIGLIPNIGVRGLNPDRSEKILILEDGVPVGLAPYNANAAYYIPLIERMDRIEVLKGSGSILHGPQTIGGVINLITPDVPKEGRVKLNVEGGTDSFFKIHAGAGKKWDWVGIDLNVVHKNGDGFKNKSNFYANDVSAKIKFDLSDLTKLTLKFNHHQQRSYQSYLGLTQDLYERAPNFNPVPNDKYEVKRYELQTTLQHFFSEKVELLTNIYHSHATRDWLRQDFSRNNGFANAPADTVQIVGDEAVDGGAIFLRSSYGSRDREFDVFGIEPRLLVDYKLGKNDHSLHTGVRFHYEDMVDQRNNRNALNAAPFNFKTETRKVKAFSLFAQNTFNVGKKLKLIPGIRLEIFDQERHLIRNNNAGVDLKGSTSHVVPIPGFGATYQLPKNTTLFSGVHRGFAPARTSDAIDSNGNDQELDPEDSWNYELGIRSNPVKWLNLETTLFYLDFENQVIPAAESQNNTTANSGKSRHLGIEWFSSINLIDMFSDHEDNQLWLTAKYSFIDTEITDNETGDQGNNLPYAPKHLASIGLDLKLKKGSLKGFNLGMEASFTGSQFTDKANTITGSNDGTVGKIDSRWLVSAYANYQIPKTNWKLFVVGNNLFDKEYIASRNPSGIFPGSDLMVRGGVSYNF
jgi:Fe(3+) dicitrate transport protein